MMMNKSIKEILGEDDGCMYQYYFHITPNKASKSETGEEVGETEKLTGKPIKTDNFIIDGKEYDTELINKALQRIRILKNAINKGIITEEEYNQAIDDLVISVEQERERQEREQEAEKYYQNILKGFRTAGEVAGEYIQTILDRIREAYQIEKEEQEKETIRKAEKEVQKEIVERKEIMECTHIKHHVNPLLFQVQRWLKDNAPEAVITVTPTMISIDLGKENRE